MAETKPGMLAGLRVIEYADETGEHCGLLLAGLGAEVIKVEPHGGSPSRRIGPFFNDEAGAENSLFFWHFNRNKQSIELPQDGEQARQTLQELLVGADVLLNSSCGELAQLLGCSLQDLRKRNPSLVTARLTPFGDVGPWKNFKGSDLVHLALGGVMMNCGYDPDPSDHYDLPPIAPQLWHAYQIAGDQLAIGIAAAIIHRERTGEGQDVSVAIHEAVSKNTELDLMSWIMRRAPFYRQTCRHASEITSRVPSLSHTKDGRWIMTVGVSARDDAKLVPFLGRYGMAADLQLPEEGTDTGGRSVPGATPLSDAAAHKLEVIQRFVGAYTYDNLPWRAAQDAGLLWAPVRKPHENATDPHWAARQSFADVWHPELGRSFRYATSKWLSTATSWQVGRRAPLLGEHNGKAVRVEAKPPLEAAPLRSAAALTSALSPHGKPFPLQGIRIFDFSWFLASAGGTRIAAALGADVLKVEWKENPDTRMAAMAPVGGREARESATSPLPGVKDADMGGQFNNKNSGKRGLSLNIRTPEGLEIAKRLIAQCDVVAEGFSPGVLERLGLGYEVLKSIKPDIIYIQQSGMGGYGTYGRFRTVGPVAASFAGTTDMSGLPEPAPPAGWGYSYLDWMGAYGFALAILGAIYHRQRTGEGQFIDSSQCEAGTFLTGPTVLDWSANGRTWSRIGNRSPYKSAAPHGAYRCAPDPERGDDRWIAIACFTQDEWLAFTSVSGLQSLRDDARFSSLEARMAHQDELDVLVNNWTKSVDAYECMTQLQGAGVPAGVCQTAGDRCDRDPQLQALQWLTEVTGTKIGQWPVAEVPARLAATPAHSAGLVGRGAPCYGEDNEHILTTLLDYTKDDVARLQRENVI
ncbi:CoA transferase [Variovorax sp. J22R24]|uniref:CaiB/BaiF CoA-transferase family protein n=1 Tax=Variovorax gracilis TaxID=3053502 RepID=UPI002577A6B3|nr:CoA transferase [Variovorax sp. J22R24]MDM0106578.1 CoA transferase [Variovorax sp. J22R24]